MIIDDDDNNSELIANDDHIQGEYKYVKNVSQVSC